MNGRINSSPYLERCLKNGKIKPFSRGRGLARKEVMLAGADLKRGIDTFKQKDYKWATVQAYYSMFHSARALLYQLNYREKSHSCLIEAVKVFYAVKGLISGELIEAIKEAKRLREEADYYGEYSEDNAKELLSKAKRFYLAAGELTKEKK
jgi:uncharacterized protein (UPF0332 family)